MVFVVMDVKCALYSKSSHLHIYIRILNISIPSSNHRNKRPVMDYRTLVCFFGLFFGLFAINGCYLQLIGCFVGGWRWFWLVCVGRFFSFLQVF